MIKELIILVKLLFASKPTDVNEVAMLSMNHFPFSGYLYMMWCGHLIYRAENQNKLESIWKSERHKIDMNHENIHLWRAQQKKSWVSFYLNYLWEWIKGGAFFCKSSYYTIPDEVEAYAQEDNLDYICDENLENIKDKYTLKNRNKLWKDAGGTSWHWKKYIKTI